MRSWVPQSSYTGTLGPFLDPVFKTRVVFPRRWLGLRRGSHSPAEKLQKALDMQNW